MSTQSKIRVALFLVLVAIGFHFYLTLHYYGLSFGSLSGESICNLNSKFNCDTVTASQFSSLFDIPIALWGAVTNFVLFVLLIGWWLGWSEDLPRLGRFSLWLSGFVALTSVVMGGISTFFIGSYCVFCMAVYVLSFLIFELIRRSQDEKPRPAAEYIRELFGPGRKYLIYILMIPILTFFFHRTFMMRYGATQLSTVVQSSVNEWKSLPASTFTAAPSFKKGADNAKMIITEFADFRCGHCKQAGPSIKAFISSHPDAAIHFYSFPLDGTCNEAIPGGDGVSCYLAKSVFCAEKTAGRGSDTHDHIFDNQEQINQSPSMEFVKKTVEDALTLWNVDLEKQKACVDSPETDQAIRAQAKDGVNAGVKGTPSFYVNGKKLSRGQLLPVLDAVYDAL